MNKKNKNATTEIAAFFYARDFLRVVFMYGVCVHDVCVRCRVELLDDDDFAFEVGVVW